MKTAVSLPDDLFEEVDAYAKRLGVSRSAVFAEALRTYLELHRPERITEALKRVYTEEDSTIDPGLARAQAHSVREKW